MNIKDYKNKIIELASKKTRKKNSFDNEYFSSSLDDFFKKNLLNTKTISLLINNFLNSKKIYNNQIGISIYDWYKKNDNKINHSLVNLLKRTNAHDEIFIDVVYRVWKSSIIEAISILIEKYNTIKTTCIIENKDDILSLLAQAVYNMNNEKGIDLVYDIILIDFKNNNKNSFYSNTTIIISNLIKQSKISIIDPLLFRIKKMPHEYQKYFRNQCEYAFKRLDLSDEIALWNLNYIDKILK